MIKPICDRCKNELKQFGGLLFSPPNKKGLVKKWHLCLGCYDSYVSIWLTKEKEGQHD